MGFVERMAAMTRPAIKLSPASKTRVLALIAEALTLFRAGRRAAADARVGDARRLLAAIEEFGR